MVFKMWNNMLWLWQKKKKESYLLEIHAESFTDENGLMSGIYLKIIQESGEIGRVMTTRLVMS